VHIPEEVISIDDVVGIIAELWRRSMTWWVSSLRCGGPQCPFRDKPRFDPFKSCTLASAALRRALRSAWRRVPIEHRRPSPNAIAFFRHTDEHTPLIFLDIVYLEQPIRLKTKISNCFMSRGAGA
jgi:hypothetical protein